jgi:hypothetical protein
MPDKIYSVRVSKGDGRPVDLKIRAKSGVQAQDEARRQQPGARLVYILGAQPAPHVLFSTESPGLLVADTEPPVLEGDAQRQEQILTCLTMRRSGQSHASIAGLLNVSKSTVGRWLKQYG